MKVKNWVGVRRGALTCALLASGAVIAFEDKTSEAGAIRN